MATVEVTFPPLPAHVRTARLVATAVARILSLVGIGEIIPIDSSLDAALDATEPGR